MCTRHSAQKVVVSVKAVGGLALGALDLGLLQLPRYCADYAFGDTILQIEDVLDAAVKMICPEMHASGSIDQLSRDAHALLVLAHAAFEHITNAKLPTHLFYIDCTVLVAKARIARDHKQPTDATQRRDDVLDDSVREIVLPRVIAHVLERQDGDRRLVREGRPYREHIEADKSIAAARDGN
jgi:hypothetical protein